MAKPKIKDIARKAGVSAGTVDRVLHNRGEVKSETRERILAITRELKYEPNIIARTLTSRKAYHFACLIPEGNADNPYWLKPLEGIHQAAKEIAHYNIYLDPYYFDLHDHDSFTLQAEKMLQDHPSGVLLAPIFTHESKDLVKRLREKGIPFVLLDANLKGARGYGFFGDDSFQSGKVAARLLFLGTAFGNEVAVLNIARDPGNSNILSQRKEGFLSYCHEHRINADNIHFLDLDDSDEYLLEARLWRFFEENPRIKSIFVTNSRIYKVARYLEVGGKQDFLLVGYDLVEPNIQFLQKGLIDFLISQSPALQGYRGVLRLFNNLVLNKGHYSNEYMPIHIVTRENYQYYQNAEGRVD